MDFLLLALKLLTYVIIADVIASWIWPSPERFPRSITSRITEPLYKPVHAVLDPQKTGGFDLAPMIVILGLELARSLIARSL